MDRSLSPRGIESENEEGNLGFEDLRDAEKHGISARYYNSIVGHLDMERILNSLSLGSHGWLGIHHSDDFEVLCQPETQLSM